MTTVLDFLRATTQKPHRIIGDNVARNLYEIVL